jgi:hypothetical protein
MAEGKISPYSLNDLKNTTDDALGNYLRGLSFKQDNTKLDVRLALGYVSVIIAGAIFYADWKLGWEATKGWTAIAVAAYAVLNGAFTYWTWAVEKGLVFEGSKNGKKVGIISPHNASVAVAIAHFTISPADRHPILTEKARSHILPRRHNDRLVQRITEHMADSRSLYYMVHSGRGFHREAISEMGREHNYCYWGRGFEEREQG